MARNDLTKVIRFDVDDRRFVRAEAIFLNPRSTPAQVEEARRLLRELRDERGNLPAPMPQAKRRPMPSWVTATKLAEILEHHRGSSRAAARALNVTERMVQRRRREFGLV